MGILPRHEPALSVLVPCAVEILAKNGEREVMAVDGGFVSVASNRVSILSQYVKSAKAISLHEAELELAAASRRLEEGYVDVATQQHFSRATAQFKAAQKASGGPR